MRLWLLILLLLPGLMAAEERGFLVFTDVLSAALQNNLDIRNARNDVRVAEAQYYQSMADLIVPELSGNFSASYSDPDSVNKSLQRINIGSQVIVLTNSWPDNYSSGINLSKVLFNGFRNWNSRNLQSENLEYMKKKLDDKIRSVRNSVFSSFYKIGILEKTYQYYMNQTSALKDRMNYTGALYQKGKLSQLDFLKAKSAYLTALPKLIQTADSVTNERISLFSQMGLTNLSQAAIAVNLDDLTNLNLKETNSVKMLDLAVSNDVALMGQNFAVIAARINKSNAENSRLPSVSGSFSYRFDFRKDTTTVNNRNWQNSWNAGLDISIPLDDWFYFSKTANTIREMEATLDKQNVLRSQALLTVLSQFQLQLGVMRECFSLLTAQKEAEEIAKLTFDLSKQQFDKGTVLALDVTDAQMTYELAEINTWQAWYDYAGAIVKLNTLMGY